MEIEKKLPVLKFKKAGSDILKGLFIGACLVLPGMSGGTALIILGIYKNFLRDISLINIKPYLMIFAGTVAGALLSALFILSLLKTHPDIIESVLLGMLLASIYPVLSSLDKKRVKVIHVIPLLIGLAIALQFTGEPLRHLPLVPTDSFLLIISGGALTSATMLLPGVSGSAVLIMINLFDDMLMFIEETVFFRNFYLVELLVFSLGLAAGLLLFARLVYTLYTRYFYPVSFLLAGLLLGTGKVLLPSHIGPEIVALVFLGGMTVLIISRKI